MYDYVLDIWGVLKTREYLVSTLFVDEWVGYNDKSYKRGVSGSRGTLSATSSVLFSFFFFAQKILSGFYMCLYGRRGKRAPRGIIIRGAHGMGTRHRASVSYHRPWLSSQHSKHFLFGFHFVVGVWKGHFRATGPMPPYRCYSFVEALLFPFFDVLSAVKSKVDRI